MQAENSRVRKDVIMSEEQVVLEPEAIVLNGVTIRKVYDQDRAESEKQNDHAVLYSGVAHIYKKLVAAECALKAIRDAAAAALPNSVEAPPTESLSTRVNNSAYLSKLSLNWFPLWFGATPCAKLGECELLKSPDSLSFPHFVRSEKDRDKFWIEHKRRFNFQVVIRRAVSVGGPRITFSDRDELLKYANSLLPSDVVKPSELQFESFVVHGSTTLPLGNDAAEAAARPSTSVSNPLFRNPQDCACNTGDSTHSFFTTSKAEGRAWSRVESSFIHSKISFTAQFLDKFLSNSVIGTDGGQWRLCVRPLHPALKHHVNFTVLSPPFYTGARVRPVKRKLDDDDAADTGAGAGTDDVSS